MPEMEAMFVGGAAAFTMLMTMPLVLLQAMAFIYLALRVRELKGDQNDPEMGIKTAYYLFYSFGILLILGGASIFMIDLMDGAFGPANLRAFQKEGFGPAKRIGLALFLSGLLFSFFFLLLLKTGTNDSKFPNVKRLYVGMRLAIAGSIVMTDITALFIILLQKNSQASSLEPVIALMLIWLPALLVHAVALHIYSSTSSSSRKSSRNDDDD